MQDMHQMTLHDMFHFGCRRKTVLVNGQSSPVVAKRVAAAPWGAIYSARGCRGLTRVFYQIIKNTFSNCHQTLKQIAMGAVNYYSFL